MLAVERGRCGVGGWWPRRLPSAARRVPCGARSWKASKELALERHRAFLHSPDSELKQLCWTPLRGATFQALRSSAALRWATSHPPHSGLSPRSALLREGPSIGYRAALSSGEAVENARREQRASTMGGRPREVQGASPLGRALYQRSSKELKAPTDARSPEQSAQETASVQRPRA